MKGAEKAAAVRAIGVIAAATAGALLADTYYNPVPLFAGVASGVGALFAVLIGIGAAAISRAHWRAGSVLAVGVVFGFGIFRFAERADEHRAAALVRTHAENVDTYLLGGGALPVRLAVLDPSYVPARGAPPFPQWHVLVVRKDERWCFWAVGRGPYDAYMCQGEATWDWVYTM